MVERIVTGFLNTNTYIYSQWKKSCIIIDPGGNHEDIITQLQKKNFTPLAIVCSHGHFDHLAAVSALIDHYRTQEVEVPIYIHEEDADYLGASAEKTHLENFRSLGIEYDPIFHGYLGSLPEPNTLLKEGDTILDTDITVIHTPGHTAGGISLYSEKDMILFSGDTLFFEGVGRTDLPGGDMNLLVDSIRTKLFTLPEATRVFPGHGPFTTIEREKNHNPFVPTGS